MQSEQINELAKALADAQAVMEDPHKTRTGKISGTTKAGKWYEYDYKYADLADVLKNVRAALSKQGIAVSQPTIMDGNSLIVRTRLMHSSGQFIESDYPVCSISGEHQKMGAALTYAKRYALSSLVGVAADEDKDGEGAEVDAPAARSGKRTREEISANAKRKSQTHDSILEDLRQIETLHALERYRQQVLTPELMTSLGNGQFLVEEAAAKREAELAAPEPNLEAQMDYIRLCLAVIDEAKTRQELAAYWADQAPSRRELQLTKEQVAGLKEAVESKRDALPAGRSDKPYGTGVYENGTERELSTTEAG